MSFSSFFYTDDVNEIKNIYTFFPSHTAVITRFGLLPLRYLNRVRTYRPD